MLLLVLAGSSPSLETLEPPVFPSLHFLLHLYPIFRFRFFFPFKLRKLHFPPFFFFSSTTTATKKQQCASDLVVTFVVFCFAFSISLQTHSRVAKKEEKEAREIFHVRSYLILFCCAVQSTVKFSFFQVVLFLSLLFFTFSKFLQQ